MSLTTDMLDKLEGYISGLTGIENVYKRRVTYSSSEDWVSKFQSADKASYRGVEIWRSGKEKFMTSFLNKVRNTFTFTIRVIIGARDKDTTITFDEIRDQVDLIVDKLDIELTLDGTVTDSEFCTFGDTELDIAVGNVFWTVSITKIIHKDVIEGSIS